MPITTLDTDFLNHLDAMKTVSTAADEATILQNQRQWMYPPLNGWSGNPLDIVDMNNAFDRTNLNNQYITIIDDLTHEDKIGTVMATKLQLDYIAAMERAFRTRHCSSVRAKIHAAARRRGQGSSNGVFTGSIVPWMLYFIQSANDDPDA